MFKFRPFKSLQSFLCILHLYQVVQVAPGIHEVADDLMGHIRHCEPKLVI